MSWCCLTCFVRTHPSGSLSTLLVSPLLAAAQSPIFRPLAHFTTASIGTRPHFPECESCVIHLLRKCTQVTVMQICNDKDVRVPANILQLQPVGTTCGKLLSKFCGTLFGYPSFFLFWSDLTGFRLWLSHLLIRGPIRLTVACSNKIISQPALMSLRLELTAGFV